MTLLTKIGGSEAFDNFHRVEPIGAKRRVPTTAKSTDDDTDADIAKVEKEGGPLRICNF